MNRRTTSAHRAQIALLLLLLCGIAVLMSFDAAAAKVTVSGLDLDSSRQRILDVKGQPKYQEGTPSPTHVEYWSDPVNVDPSLSIDFDAAGAAIRIEGGRPEINGESVRGWSLTKVESALGPAAGSSRGQAIDSAGQVDSGERFLKYPDRRLLVSYSPQNGIAFTLFRGSR